MAKKIEKKNNSGNEFLVINTYEFMTFIKKIFLQVAEASSFFKTVKKDLTIWSQKTGLLEYEILSQNTPKKIKKA